MIRKFLTLDGDVLEQTEWDLKPIDRCFYCEDTLMEAYEICWDSLDGNHDWITICSPDKRS